MVPGAKKLLYPCLPLLLWAAGVPLRASADQFVALDLVYEATTQNTINSEFKATAATGIPSNWRAPIDYANGTAHVRFEVMSKPSTAPTLLNICFRNPSSYACMDYPPAYTATGVYDFADTFPEFWQYAMVDWAMGVQEVMLVLKDQAGRVVQANGNFYPYKMRVTISIVSPGATYVPPTSAPTAGTGAGVGGSGGAAGRGGSAGMAGSRAGAGATGAGAGGVVAMDAGAMPGDPAEPSKSDAATLDAGGAEDFEEPEDTAQIDAQPVAMQPNKRAPPPGGIAGNCAVFGPAIDRDAGALWILGLAFAMFSWRRRLGAARPLASPLL